MKTQDGLLDKRALVTLWSQEVYFRDYFGSCGVRTSYKKEKNYSHPTYNPFCKVSFYWGSLLWAPPSRHHGHRATQLTSVQTQQRHSLFVTRIVFFLLQKFKCFLAERDLQFHLFRPAAVVSCWWRRAGEWHGLPWLIRFCWPVRTAALKRCCGLYWPGYVCMHACMHVSFWKVFSWGLLCAWYWAKS